MTIELASKIDVKENLLYEASEQLLSALLKDMTTGKNLIWATDNYEKYGTSYCSNQQIKSEFITGENGNIIKPRTKKNKAIHQQRARQKAEVFTPAWVCNAQNNLIDNAWFGVDNQFNHEKPNGWKTNTAKITFPNNLEKSWQSYVKENRLEITCGEAPYITSRYDAVSGKYIDVKNRIGLLDRKLRVVSENTSIEKDWILWATRAVKSVYAYDWQGDNVLLARENLLYTLIEFHDEQFDVPLATEQLIKFAKIISWNVWQMDGIKCVVPDSCIDEKKSTITLFGEEISYSRCEGCAKGNIKLHTGVYCKIMDWREGKAVRFVDLFKEGRI